MAVAPLAQTAQAREKVAALRKDLEKQGDSPITKAAFKKMTFLHLGRSGRLPGAFRERLLREHGIRLIFSRSKENVNALLPAVCEIKYFEEGENTALYFVGEKKQGIKRTIKSACHLRKVTAAAGSRLIFKDLLPTMDVDFVRTGQSTVIPFPFKYLREGI